MELTQIFLLFLKFWKYLYSSVTNDNEKQDQRRNVRSSFMTIPSNATEDLQYTERIETFVHKI